MKKTMGLCKGRHNINQVEEYIYPNELNPLDLDAMDKIAGRQLQDVKELDLYVTGLTVALISVVNKCLENDIKLTLYHFDRESNSYYPQAVKIFSYQDGYDDGYRDGAYDSNFNRAVNKILVDYEKTIKELNTTINDLENENYCLKNKINELEKEISNEY